MSLPTTRSGPQSPLHKRRIIIKNSPRGRWSATKELHACKVAQSRGVKNYARRKGSFAGSRKHLNTPGTAGVSKLKRLGPRFPHLVRLTTCPRVPPQLAWRCGQLRLSQKTNPQVQDGNQQVTFHFPPHCPKCLLLGSTAFGVTRGTHPLS